MILKEKIIENNLNEIGKIFIDTLDHKDRIYQNISIINEEEHE